MAEPTPPFHAARHAVRRPQLAKISTMLTIGHAPLRAKQCTYMNIESCQIIQPLRYRAMSLKSSHSAIDHACT
jgi:hypothetical protein